jgi:hypothetical protein
MAKVCLPTRTCSNRSLFWLQSFLSSPFLSFLIVLLCIWAQSSRTLSSELVIYGRTGEKKKKKKNKTKRNHVHKTVRSKIIQVRARRRTCNPRPSYQIPDLLQQPLEIVKMHTITIWRRLVLAQSDIAIAYSATDKRDKPCVNCACLFLRSRELTSLESAGEVVATLTNVSCAPKSAFQLLSEKQIRKIWSRFGAIPAPFLPENLDSCRHFAMRLLEYLRNKTPMVRWDNVVGPN